MADIIRCKDCKHFEKWRTSESAKRFGQVYECELCVITSPSPDDYCSKAKRKEENIPLQEMRDKENLEIKKEIEDLSKRIDTLEKQMKNDAEEQLKKLKADLDYAKFCYDLYKI